MSLELLASETLLHIFDYLIASKRKTRKKLRIIHDIQCVCKLFCEVVHLHPIMRLVNEYKRSGNDYEALKVMRIYTEHIILRKIAVFADSGANITIENMKTTNPEFVNVCEGFNITDAEIYQDRVYIDIIPNAYNTKWDWRLSIVVHNKSEVKTTIIVTTTRTQIPDRYDVSQSNDISRHVKDSLQKMIKRLDPQYPYANMIIEMANGFERNLYKTITCELL
jgi:hypothetical protein